MVVGFAGSERSDSEVGAGYFGWLFGPQFSVRDTHTLGLEQTVRNYGVNADISVPGWWSYLTLDVRTVWVSNWAQPDLLGNPELGDPPAHVVKHVNLPVTLASYDSLTNFVAAEEYLENSGIFANYVVPDTVPTCASSVTFQIAGANIWRADSIYLAGVKAKSVTVMPDMKGVAAQFDMDEVFGKLAFTDSLVQRVPLSVSAEQGSAAPLIVYIVGKRTSSNGVAACQSPLLLATNVKSLAPTIVSWAPTEVCTDTQSFPMVVQGVNLFNGFKAAAGGLFTSKVSDGNPFEQKLEMTRTGSKKDPTPRTLSIVMTGTRENSTESDSFPLNISVKECKAESDKTAAGAGPGSPGGKGAAGKVTLVTTTVKLAKDQPVEVKAKVPESFSLFTIGVRPQAPKSATKAATPAAAQASGKASPPVEIAWTESAPITNLTPGDSVDIKGTVDLSNVRASPKDQLEVRVGITLRPGTIPQYSAADKTLTVAQ
jgi:hypothetical protein